jgi:hypothetical protein
MVDADLAPIAKSLVQQAAALQARDRAGAPAGILTEADRSSRGIPLGVLRERNAEHCGEYWEDCEALYLGGQALLGDPEVMKRIFPSHNNEAGTVYEERKKRAFYLPYPAKIIGMFCAGLQTDPLRHGEPQLKEEQPEPPGWERWNEWSKRVTAPGAGLEDTYSLHGLVVEAVRMASIKQSAWVLADLPILDPVLAASAQTLADQETLGLLQVPYLCLLDASEVTAWENDAADGQLKWATRHTCVRRRPDPGQKRGNPEHTWTTWTRTGWSRYSIEIDPANPPKDTDIVPRVDVGEHSFGCVPLIRFTLPPGLCVMQLVESAAREWFNKRNALSWAEYKSLFAVLYEFIAAPAAAPRTIGGPEADPNRAINQVRGQGYIMRRGEKDSAKYIGPDVAPFSEARTSTGELMQEMFRVASMMAASADMKAAALQRSADSKGADGKDTQAVLIALGMFARELAEKTIRMVALAAPVGMDLPDDVGALGLDTFDMESVMDLIARAVELFAGVPILSPTFKTHVLDGIYRRLLGDDVPKETLDRIRKEIEDAVASEDLLLEQATKAMAAADAAAAVAPVRDPAAAPAAPPPDAGGKRKPSGKPPKK